MLKHFASDLLSTLTRIFDTSLDILKPMQTYFRSTQSSHQDQALSNASHQPANPNLLLYPLAIAALPGLAISASSSLVSAPSCPGLGLGAGTKLPIRGLHSYSILFNS